VTGAAIAAEALTWVDTPARWNQSQKGHGCDCKGLVQGVAREVGRPEAQSFYGLFIHYRGDRPVPVALLRQGLAELFDKVDGTLEDGDILLLRMRGKAQHLAIVTGGGARAVHADAWGSGRVRERRLGALLQVCPLHSAWRWRNGG
jgi:cell wall-associated NlpC family hydrolase